MEVTKKHESLDSLPKKLQDVINYLFKDESGRLYISDSTKIKNVVENEDTNILKIKIRNVLDLSFKHTVINLTKKGEDITEENLSFIIKFAGEKEVLFIQDFDKNMKQIKEVIEDIEERIKDIIVDCLDLSLEKIRKGNNNIFSKDEEKEEKEENNIFKGDDSQWTD